MSFKIASAQYPLTAHQDYFAWERHIESWVQEAVVNKAELLVFPEYGSMELVSVMSEQIQNDLILQVKEMSNLQEKFLATFKALAKKYSCSILAPSLPVHDDNGKIINRAFFVGSGGGVAYQDKSHMTRFEEEWGVQSGEPSLQIFETQFGDIGVSICFDVEFPMAANKLAKEGVKILLAPSCTESMAGCNRVHIGARGKGFRKSVLCGCKTNSGECLMVAGHRHQYRFCCGLRSS